MTERCTNIRVVCLKEEIPEGQNPKNVSCILVPVRMVSVAWKVSTIKMAPRPKLLVLAGTLQEQRP
jgi:hypothetical protein